MENKTGIALLNDIEEKAELAKEPSDRLKIYMDGHYKVLKDADAFVLLCKLDEDMDAFFASVKDDKEKIVLQDFASDYEGQVFSNKILSDIKNCVDTGKYDIALSRAEAVSKELQKKTKKMIGPSGVLPPMNYFFNDMELSLDEDYFPVQSSLPLPVDAVSLLTLECQALFFLDRVEESKALLRKAMDLNPVVPDLSFLLGDIDLKSGSPIAFEMDMERAHQFLYTQETFDRYFSYALTYYKEIAKNPKKREDLLELHKKFPKIQDFSANLPEETRKELLQHGFDFTLSPIVEKTARRRFLDAFAEDDKDGVSFYFEILRTFLPSDKIGSLMREVKEKKKEKESKAVSE